MVYAVFSLPYIAIAVWGYQWMMKDDVETRVSLLRCLFTKIICKTCVDCLMIVQLCLMKNDIIYQRLIARTKRVTLMGKNNTLDNKTKAWLEKHGR